MKLSYNEKEYLSNDPEALRLAAEYHDIQIMEAKARKRGSTAGSERRRELLLTEARRIEREANHV